MATLTTSWQSYASASWTSGSVKVTFYLEAKYSTQSVQNNTTTIQTRLRSTINYSASGSGYNFTCSYCDTVSGTGVWVFENEVITSSGNKVITHNTDGTKNLSLSASAKNSYLNINKSMSVTVSLPKINRLAIVTDSNDFTDEENPTLTFDNPAGFDIKPYLNFYDNGNNLVYSLTRNTTITSPYTWSITNEERTAIRNATNMQPSYRVQVGVDTYNNGTKIGYNSIAKQMTYVNAEPTQSITIEETNQKVIDVLNNDSSATYIIQNASELHFTSVPTALKNSAISNVSLYQNGILQENLTTSPYSFSDTQVINNVFNVLVTDSRGLTKNNFLEWTVGYFYIEYLPIDILSVSFERPNPTSDNIVLNAEIKYTQTTFGSTNNVPTIKWKKGETGTETTISSSDYTIDTTNNKITITNLTLTNAISYQDEAQLYLLVEDLLTSDSDGNIVHVGIPTCDAGEHDFQVNGDLFVAETDRTNPMNIKEKITWLETQNVLWSGAWYMNASQSIDLTNTPILNQPKGIILLWSAYDGTQARDWDWVCNFIPKHFVQNHDGNGMTFNMCTTNFGNVGAKYLYVSNTSLSGHADNSATGTGTSGISYKNNHWVLRYVIGI